MLDYKKLGFRAGLEIHQQLNSGTKLFCRCPIMKSEEFPIEVHRKMRPVQSELGEEDPAALFEFLRGKTFVYRANHESSCLVELDEFPPLPMNQNALKTTVQMAKMLKCSIVDEIHVMRKTVIDGSAVSGFQRTALIATDGYIETDFGRVGIQTINIEEDSAPAMIKGDVIEYRLDRLGVPLIEIATDSSLSSPKEVREAAEKIGALLRSVDVVRGIGSIRQDVNISIAEGNRVEIKGFQRLEDMEKLVENEVLRQISLLEIRGELKKRGFKEIKPESKDVTKLFKNTKSNFVRKALENGQHVTALVLPKFSGLLKQDCGDRTFGKELSAYPGSYGFGIIHSDEDLSRYSLVGEFNELRKELHAGDEDLVLIIVGNNVEKAVSALVQRANYCVVGVPKETRVADGIGSKYMRPLPGSGRLYPESDVPPIRVTRELLNVELPKIEISDALEAYYAPTIEAFKKHGMSEVDIIALIKHKILRGDQEILINKIANTFPNLDPIIIAKTVIEIPKEIKSRFGLDFNLDENSETILYKVMDAVYNKKIPQQSIINVLVDYLKGKSIEDSVNNYSIMSDEELRDMIKSLVKENPEKSDSALMGTVMAKVKGRADGKKVSEMIKELR